LKYSGLALQKMEMQRKILDHKDLLQALGAYGFLTVAKGKKYFLKHVPEAPRMLKEEAAAVKADFPELNHLSTTLD
jgi:hypothetical protein